jgi:polysaccharide pyruvyl transferase WcaK-like protein
MLVHVSNTGTGKRNLGTRNKGGQLMVIAIADHYRNTETIVGVDDSFGSAQDRNRIGVERVSFSEYGCIESIAIRIQNLLGKFDQGYASCRRDLHLNAAGFAYGDGWGTNRIKTLASWNRRSYSEGCPSVLLPQAFGPFKQNNHASLFVHAVKNVSLIYARDRLSLKYLQELLPNDDRVKLAPDFTIAVSGKASDEWIQEDPGDRLLIVPNSRMLDKQSPEAGERYVSMLTDVVKQAPKIGLRPIFVIHSNEDAVLASEIMRQDALLATSVISPCPVELKGILAHGKVALASRFHSVVSALSGCTPTLVAGWSHKYAELLEDFGVPDLLLNSACSGDEVIDRIRSEADDNRQISIKNLLSSRHRDLAIKVENMWSEVDALLPHASAKATCPAAA